MNVSAVLGLERSLRATSRPDGSRVVLGGSWCMTCQVYGLPVLERYAAPTFYSNEQGFRCAKDAPA